MAENSLKKGRYTRYSNKIGLVDSNTGGFINNSPEVVLNFPFKDCVLEAGMNKEDAGREERFLHSEIDAKDIDTLFDPKVLTDFRYIDKDGEKKLTKDDDIEFFDENGDLKQNLLIKGNNLLALHTLKEKLTGKVKLIYIDPPYNTGSDGFKYNDTFNHSSWLVFMKNRLETAKQLLANDGCIFVQCDDNEQAYLKILMDEIFTSDNFVNCIAVKMSEVSGVKMTHARTRFPKIKEYLLFYRKNASFEFEDIDKYKNEVWDDENNIFLDGLSQEMRNKIFAIEESETYSIDDINEINNILKNVKMTPLSQKIRELNLSNNKVKDWMFANAYRIIKTAGSSSLSKLIKERYPIADLSQDIKADISKNGILFFYITNFNRETKQPRMQVIFADSNIYKNPCDFWQDIRTTGAISTEGGVSLLNGKKPEKLIYRIVKMTTRQNDIVLDYHLGSGTTCAVAHKMNRRWIGVEQMDYIETLAKERLENVINGDQTGISNTVNWQGGGSFVYFELKKYNQAFIDRIMEAASIPELEEIYEDMQKNAFLKFWFDKKEFEKDENFRKLDIYGRKQALVDILDENQFYLNYDEMEDSKYHVAEDEKVLTKRFYQDFEETGEIDDAEE